ncbi:MAG: methyl-accepting chemotaxis protein [Vallitaleaceae bacterium]|nr:methyl-accepting chemotaxis protein [Vallitaleaceae bacterium]
MHNDILPSIIAYCPSIVYHIPFQISYPEITKGSATQASNISLETKQLVITGNEQMNHTVTAMEEISQSATDIIKIIKTFDAIAFQTNILVLNAAAKDTTELIETSILKA